MNPTTAISPKTTLAQIAVDVPGAMAVLDRRGLDYCYRGQESLAAACARLGLAEADVIDEIERACAQANAPAQPSAPDPRTLSTLDLVNHILDRHHGYIRKAMPEAIRLARQAAEAHAEHDLGVEALRDAVEELAAALHAHLAAEEKRLFPALVRLRPGERPSGDAAAELAGMRSEHDDIGRALERIRGLASGYRLPAGASETLRALYILLRDFEADMRRHEHLENNVLAPRFTAHAGLDGGARA